MEMDKSSADALGTRLKKAAEFGTLAAVRELLEAGAPVDWTIPGGVS